MTYVHYLDHIQSAIYKEQDDLSCCPDEGTRKLGNVDDKCREIFTNHVRTTLPEQFE